MTLRHGSSLAGGWTILASLFMASMLNAPVAHAADWNYRVRPDDNIWDLSRRYMKADVPWQKLQEYNQVTDPYHLPPGMKLRIPIEWLRVQPAKATVVAVAGKAQVELPGQAASAVEPGVQLGFGSRLITGPGASLTLQFADGSRVLMQHDSQLELDRMSAYGRTGMVDTRLRLQHGRVSTSVTPMTGAAAHFSVETPGIISSVRGTHFRVAADASTQRSQTEVLTGRVDVAGERRHTLVDKGMGVAVNQGAQPGKSQPLLPAPRLHCPTGPVTALPYQFDWPALDGASRYRVQVAPTDRFEVLLMDRLVDGNHASLPDLPDGDYALQVHGVDAGGLEGSDAACSIRIDGHPLPPLILEPQADGKVRDPRPRFRWTSTDDAASYAWQLASDEQFTQPLGEQNAIKGDSVRAPRTLPPGHYYWRVASRDHHGKLGPYTSPMTFDLVPEPPTPAVGDPVQTRDKLSLGWSAGAPGQRYHVQMDRDPAFPHPLVDEVVEQARLEIDKPASGRWYVRVQVIESDGYTGNWGPVQKLKLPCKACRVVAAGGGAALLWLLL